MSIFNKIKDILGIKEKKEIPLSKAIKEGERLFGFKADGGFEITKDNKQFYIFHGMIKKEEESMRKELKKQGYILKSAGKRRVELIKNE